MHFPTPHLPGKKSDKKRKASLESVAAEDEAPVPIAKKVSKSKKKAKKTQAKKDKTATPEPALPQQHTPSSPPPSRSPSLTALPTLPREHSGTTEIHPTTTTEDADPQPRRSSRIKASMESVAHTWTKARPYIERINGTIMPLEHQGTNAYYARDGVKVD